MTDVTQTHESEIARAPAGNPLVQSCLRALARGHALLHPTDTLPGLSFDPRGREGAQVLASLKGRKLSQVCLGLVPDLATARRYYSPLPAGWDERLARLWPGSLSVIFRASPEAPRALVSADGTIGLRVPQLADDAAWVYDLMRALDAPLPTTSVNATGEPPLAVWSDAAAFCGRDPTAFAPDWAPLAPCSATSLPSTIIRLLDDGAFTVVRQGAVPLEALS